MKELGLGYFDQRPAGIPIIPQGNSEINPLLQNVVANLDRYIERHNAGLDKKPLKKRQLTVFEDMRNFLNNGGTEGYVELPCAVGKTVLYAKFIDATRMKTLIVTDRILAINQTEEKLENFAEGINISKVYSKDKKFDGEATITTYESLRINIQNGKLNPKDYPLLILDEFDQAGPKATEEIRKFPGIKLGFSATLPKHTFLKEVHSMSIKEAVQEGLNCGFSVILAKPKIDLKNVAIDSAGEFDKVQLGKTINIRSLNQAWVDLYKEKFEGRLALAYCAGIEHAKAMSKLYVENGVPAGFICGRNSPNEQREILANLKKGKIKVLCSSDILIRALDEPKVSVIFNVNLTWSPRERTQTSGRGLRIDPDDPNKHAYIVEAIYETGNAKKLPISFAQIVGSAHVTADREENYDNEARNRKSIYSGEVVFQNTEIDIRGLKIILDPKKVMEIVRENENKKYETASSGWLNASNLARIYRRAQTTIVGQANKYRKEHPEWFEIRKNRMGLGVEHYSLELTKILDEINSKIPPLIPDKWFNAHEISVATGITYPRANRKMKILGAKNPQLTKEVLTKRHMTVVGYAPELVQKFAQEVAGTQLAPSE